jgi:hypothetical protein
MSGKMGNIFLFVWSVIKNRNVKNGKRIVIMLKKLWRLIKSIVYAMTFVFMPRDYPEARVKIKNEV